MVNDQEMLNEWYSMNLKQTPYFRIFKRYIDGK